MKKGVTSTFDGKMLSEKCGCPVNENRKEYGMEVKHVRV
jgi:hypothetical protein